MQLISGSPTPSEVRRPQILSLSSKKIVKIEHFFHTDFQDFSDVYVLKTTQMGLKRVFPLLASYLCGNRCPVHLIASMERSAAHNYDFILGKI